MLGPIFAREWLTLPRRPRHYAQRSLFLAVLWVLIVTVWQASVGWERSATDGDLAVFGLVAFHVLTYLQLVLVLFFAALSTASNIAQEKDRRTFLLLLLTDLRNDEIVLGKLFGSLLQIVLLLLAAVPMAMLLLLMGGIAPEQVLQATLVQAMTAVAAGSLGGLIALWRDKTFPALALTVLFLVLYLCLTRALDVLGRLWPDYGVEAWSTWVDPFTAARYVLNPLDADVGGLAPAYRFCIGMGVLSFVLNGLAIACLRVWNPSGEPIMQREGTDAKPTGDIHAAPGRVRAVWANPILWREIATRAYGRRPLLAKAAYLVVVGLIVYFAFTGPPHRAWSAAYGLVPVTILSLLLLSAQAVTAITSERDLGALDLLLVTSLSPREFIFGKILGVLYNTKEYLLPPLVLIVVYALQGKLATPSTPMRNLEAGVALFLGAVVLVAFILVLGIHVALRTDNSRLAVLHALGTVFFLTVGTMVCIYLILINGRFEYQWLSFSGFIFAGVGGLWWILSGERASAALTLACWALPIAVFYSITTVLIGKPGRLESSDPLLPFLVTGGAFGFALAAMLVPLLTEFDAAMGRTGGGD